MQQMLDLLEDCAIAALPGLSYFVTCTLLMVS